MGDLSGNGRPVMSEYERQRQACQREMARERHVRRAIRFMGLVLMVGAGYAVAGYFAYVRLPTEIANLERQVASAEATQDVFGRLKARSGLVAAGQDPVKQAAALERLLGSPEFARLDGNTRAVADLVRRLTTSRGRLQTLRKQILQGENRVKMLNREFEGPVGKGSATWQRKMDKAKAELDRLKDDLQTAENMRAEALTAARARVKELDSIASADGTNADDRERLENLRAWRDRLTVWPLPILKGLLFKTKDT